MKKRSILSFYLLKELKADLEELWRGFEGQDHGYHLAEFFGKSLTASVVKEESQESQALGSEPATKTVSPAGTKSKEKFLKILSDQVKFLTPVAFPDRGDFELTVRGGSGPRPDRVMCKGLWTSALADMCRLDTQLAEFLWRSMFPKVWAVLKDDQKVSVA